MERCIAYLQNIGGAEVKGFCCKVQRSSHAELLDWSDESIEPLQRPSLCATGDPALRPVVPGLLPELPGSAGDAGERGLKVDASTLYRWVQAYAPELDLRIRKKLKPTTACGHVDETYIRVKGVWTYLYRAVDASG
jgi:hypothetical protein